MINIFLFEGDPLEPEFKSCVVENWEHLRCMWTPTREEQLKYTLTTKTYQNFTYSFVYSRVRLGLDQDSHFLSVIESCSSPGFILIRILAKLSSTDAMIHPAQNL